MSDLPEYVRHVRMNHADFPDTAWCGAKVTRMDVPFADIDAAAFNGRAQGRHIPCPKCRDAIIAALMNGAEDKTS